VLVETSLRKREERVEKRIHLVAGAGGRVHEAGSYALALRPEAKPSLTGVSDGTVAT
jgi:hypothetical protein